MNIPTIQPTDVIREFARCFNQRDFDAITALVHVDLIDHHLPPTMPPGRVGALTWYRLLTDTLDMRIDIQATVAVGELVAVRASITGRHVGEFGGLEATGRPFATSMMSFERIEHGCIVERWELVDHAAVVDQLTDPATPSQVAQLAG